MQPSKRKSRTFRRVPVKVPGGATKMHYRLRKPSKPVCAGCKKDLKGVARERPAKMQKLSKTQKRPERPYGGVLCSACMRKRIIENIQE